MHQIPFLHDVVVLFGVALAVIALSYRLHLPSVVGFLVTGMLVGPSGFGWIADTKSVELFAELGVVFLLFGIGLEISITRLRQLGRLLFLGGGLQVALTIAAAAGVAVLLGASLRLAVYLGSVVALSSTAIVLKLYFERRELEAPHGQVATGILRKSPGSIWRGSSSVPGRRPVAWRGRGRRRQPIEAVNRSSRC